MNLSKKAHSKMHALGRCVAVVYECGCAFTTMPDSVESEDACCIFMSFCVLFCSNIEPRRYKVLTVCFKTPLFNSSKAEPKVFKGA